MEKIKFYKHKTNKTVLELLDGNIDDNYIEIKANTTEAAVEKHLPVYEKQGENIIVTVGSTLHPMQEDHYIMWIAYLYDNKLEIVELKPTDEPKAIFKYVSGAEIYAYCNLHGLWMTTIF